MALLDAVEGGYEPTEINGRPVPFANMRLSRGTVLAGIFCYDVRDSDVLDGSMAEIEAVVVVNHWETVLCKDPFPVDEYGSYYPEDWEYPGKNISLGGLQKTDREQLVAYLLPEAPQTEPVIQKSSP